MQVRALNPFRLYLMMASKTASAALTVRTGASSMEKLSGHPYPLLQEENAATTAKKAITVASFFIVFFIRAFLVLVVIR